MSTFLRHVRALGPLTLLAAACATQEGAGPIAGPSFNETTTDPERVSVCKAAGAPDGTYDFTVSQVGGRGGTLLVGGAFSLAPGECVDVWEALPNPPEPDTPAVNVTVSEVAIPANVVFDSLMIDSEAEGPSTTFDPTGSMFVNFYHGGTFTFFNSANPMAPGRMTGGGGQLKIDDVRITRGFTIHCDITLSNNLEINWTGGNKWHIDKPLTSATCIDDPDVDPTPPDAPFDTFIGEGIGELNGIFGSIVRFTFIDFGEPGSSDQAFIDIWAPGADPDTDPPVLTVGGILNNGNIQAHFDQPHK